MTEMRKSENMDDFLQTLPGVSNASYDDQFNGTIILTVILTCLSFIFIAYNVAKIVVLLPSTYSKDKRLAFDAIITAICGFILELSLIIWDFVMLAKLTTGRFETWPPKLSLPESHGRNAFHLMFMIINTSLIRMCFWSYLYKFNYMDSYGDVKPNFDRHGRLKFSAMRMFHFLAFHKAPFVFVERFFYEKYIVDTSQGQFIINHVSFS